jgi:hypothetical protein
MHANRHAPYLSHGRADTSCSMRPICCLLVRASVVSAQGPRGGCCGCGVGGEEFALSPGD